MVKYNYFQALMRNLPIALIILLAACSSTKTYVSPMALQPVGERDFDVAVNQTDTHLNVTVSFRNNQYYGAVMQYGFTLYVDGDPKFKRSMGFTYPLGIHHFINMVPGAREAVQRGERVEAVDDLSTRLRPLSARLLYRTNPKSSAIFGDVTITQLEAQGVVIRMDETQALLRIDYQIPLETTRVYPYAVDAKDRELLLGFEIKPPIVEGTSGMDPSRGGNDRMGMGTTRTPYGSINRDDELSQSMRRQMMGDYVKWVRIKL